MKLTDENVVRDHFRMRMSPPNGETVAEIACSTSITSQILNNRAWQKPGQMVPCAGMRFLILASLFTLAILCLSRATAQEKVANALIPSGNCSIEQLRDEEEPLSCSAVYLLDQASPRPIFTFIVGDLADGNSFSFVTDGKLLSSSRSFSVVAVTFSV